MKKYLRFNYLFLIGLAIFASGLTACGPEMVRTGPVQTRSETVALGAAESARVEIDMGLGELNVSGGATELMEADFTFNVADWEPEVDYRVSGDDGRLTVKQPESSFADFPDDVRYRWDLGLNDSVPLDLKINLGVGVSDIDLRSVAVKSVEIDAGSGDVSVQMGGSLLTDVNVNTGVGEITLDLTGDWQNDATISVDAGVGDLVVIVPDDVDAVIDTDTGIGSVNATGFSFQNGSYVNNAEGDTAVTLQVNIAGGVGQITLEMAE